MTPEGVPRPKVWSLKSSRRIPNKSASQPILPRLPLVGAEGGLSSPTRRPKGCISYAVFRTRIRTRKYDIRNTFCSFSKDGSGGAWRRVTSRRAFRRRGVARGRIREDSRFRQSRGLAAVGPSGCRLRSLLPRSILGTKTTRNFGESLQAGFAEFASVKPLPGLFGLSPEIFIFEEQITITQIRNLVKGSLQA